MGLAEPPSMADDGVVKAKRTLPREKIQGDHPGSALPSVSGNAIKRITAGVKARCWFSLPGLRRRTGLHPPSGFIVERKKECSLPWINGGPSYRLAGIKGLHGSNFVGSRSRTMSGGATIHQNGTFGKRALQVSDTGLVGRMRALSSPLERAELSRDPWTSICVT